MELVKNSLVIIGDSEEEQLIQEKVGEPSHE